MSSLSKNETNVSITQDGIDWDMGDSQVLDRDGFLSRLMGEEELLVEILQEYVRLVPDQLISIQAAVESGDHESLHQQSHSLKGSSGNVGAQRLERVALLLEEAAETADLERAKVLVAMLASEFDAVRKEVEGPNTSL